MLHVIQLVLPLYEEAQPDAPATQRHDIVKAELTRHFGGCTAHTRTPAEGRWKEGGLGLREDMVIYEVMSPMLDAGWWEWYQEALKVRFQQVEVVIRMLRMICL
jgi:hypothetical protein